MTRALPEWFSDHHTEVMRAEQLGPPRGQDSVLLADTSRDNGAESCLQHTDRCPWTAAGLQEGNKQHFCRNKENHKISLHFQSCCCSVAQSCLTLCSPMDCSTSGFPVLHCLLEFAQVHVHWTDDSIQQSYPLPPSSFAFSLCQHQGLFQWVCYFCEIALEIVMVNTCKALSATCISKCFAGIPEVLLQPLGMTLTFADVKGYDM